MVLKGTVKANMFNIIRSNVLPPSIRTGIKALSRSSKRDLMITSRLTHAAAADEGEASPQTYTYNFETLKVDEPHEYVFHVEMNRPKKMNAMNKAFWRELRECFITLNKDPQCRSVVLSGSGRLFSAGIDLMDMADMAGLVTSSEDVARKVKVIKAMITDYQQSFTVIEKCTKPVIAAIHNACIGGGVNMIGACDIRYCTSDAWFSIKEVDIGMAADVGILQRLPKIVGNDSLARELAFTARKFHADEALQFGFVSRILPTKKELMESAMETAKYIASKSPVAVQGTKVNMNYSRDHSIDESLHFMAHWNMTMLLSEDVMKSVMAAMDKSGPPPQFSKL